ncbi:MAG TPA: hypothetical protein VKQ35_20545 [Phenylobacterium sp.]|nr:hypothetical protein [Phenylobacterium sp.]
MSSTTGRLDIGRVIQETFAVLGRNFVTFLVLAAILVGLPALLSGYLNMTYMRAGVLFAWQSYAGSFLAAIGLYILQGTVIYGTVTELNGKPASIGACLSVGLSSFLPLLVIGILSYLAIVLGMILLVVPGLMILVAWIVAVPVYVAERPGLFAVFGRSAALTRGNRWRIFAVLILYLVAFVIIEALAGVFGNASRIASGAGIPMFQALLLLPLIAIASGMLTSAGIATLYVELRRVNEGVGPADLAAVFD